MYEELFQTTNRPFRATPDPRYYFPFESMEQTRQTVLRVVRRAEGPAVVMGNVGLGKSLLSLILAEDCYDRFDVVRLHATRLCSRRALLQNILFELKLPFRDLSEGELRLSLMERMEPGSGHAADGLVLIVDEAHTLPVKLIEELRLITNFARGGQCRAQLVLVGNLQLEETFALPELNSFNQRIAARCFLQPMNRRQTFDYIRHQFQCVRIESKEIITSDAMESVFVASDGIPRLINQVMDHALILAVANGQTPISAALIQEAWSDLQQLPVAWATPEQKSGPAIEFGVLSEEEDFENDPAEDFDVPGIESQLPTIAPTVTRADVHSFWPAGDDLEDFGPEQGSDVDMLVLEDDEEFDEAAIQTRNMFATWNTSALDESHAAAQAFQPKSSVPQPAGEYFEIEIDRRDLSETLSRVKQSVAAQNAVVQPVAGNPFGEDFDEEFSIASEDVKRWQANKQSAVAKSDTRSPAIALAPEYEPTSPTVAPISEPFASTTATTLGGSDFASDYDAQFVAVAAASGTPEALQQEIEEIISQLNFSAFSVELSNVEHISPDFNRAPAAQAPVSSTDGSYRVYPLHTDEEIEEVNITLLDDDRDLLVIEEDVPASVRFNPPGHATSSGAGMPPGVTAPPSYPELFQQLRS
ncbi:MAG: AAA family ATPase [Pirellulales bacterium]